jgi:predicted Rossmann fold nucleotide-binding protein DprA/Smf involved in DNA uptake
MMNYKGEIRFLDLQKTAFLCSQKCPAEIVLKSYDWAKEQREKGNCIVCGNHSQIEKDVFEILLKGKQPLILVLPRSLKKNWEPKIIEAITQNRLLVISPFIGDQNKRITRENAIQKNETIISLADKIMVGYKTKNGQLDKLLKGKEYDEL